ncbi:MAG TPA: hypothetical protein VNT56_11650 [Acidimicrobiales bacterium]|nr:hypothetical protein [Acidimicrobiales bacterium]
MSLVQVVLEVHRHLDGADRAHAFGGALALAHIAEPRGTVDIDVNVFSPMAEVGAVLEVFSAIDLVPERDPEHWFPRAGIRLRRAGDPSPSTSSPTLTTAMARSGAGACAIASDRVGTASPSSRPRT